MKNSHLYVEEVVVEGEVIFIKDIAEGKDSIRGK